MTRELTIGSPDAAHIRWEDWNVRRERMIRELIERMVRFYDWQEKKRKLKK